ncbi:unnamed protein product [Caenorhabditis auriculariae]|uniref:Reverse transcriptase domain-containing protein n=1 Tax=Caenorhabditis auriculariae TaxID=2777116 RepID=A0A8S1GUV5_9PELO|nr:unnamed protein product [Caenorhabditis auriculariae]
MFNFYKCTAKLLTHFYTPSGRSPLPLSFGELIIRRPQALDKLDVVLLLHGKAPFSLENAVRLVNFDIIGLCEIRRASTGSLVLNDTKHILYYHGKSSQAGVGFLVHKDLAASVEFTPVNDCLAFIDVKIKKERIRIFQVYAPTTDYTDEVYSMFLDDLEKVLSHLQRRDRHPGADVTYSLTLGKPKSNKASGPDMITLEMLLACEDIVVPHLMTIFNESFMKERAPQSMPDFVVRLLHKKGSCLDIGNYRPVAPVRRVQTVHLDTSKKSYAFLTAKNTLVVTEMIQKSQEYEFPLYLMFVDYKKAFDSVEFGSLWTALSEFGVHSKIVMTLKNIYEEAEVSVRIRGQDVPVRIQKSVRQGDTISPDLFNATLEHIFRRLNWQNYGFSVNGKILSHLRFADDIVLLASSTQKIQEMANQLAKESKKAGLAINFAKMFIMANRAQKNFEIDGKRIAYTDGFIYLGTHLYFAGGSKTEIQRTCLTRRNVFNIHKAKCIEPAFLYGSETWTLKKKERDLLETDQRKMMRWMLGVTATRSSVGSCEEKMAFRKEDLYGRRHMGEENRGMATMGENSRSWTT